jgi:hypothetical protein
LRLPEISPELSALGLSRLENWAMETLTANVIAKTTATRIFADLIFRLLYGIAVLSVDLGNSKEAEKRGS